MPCSRAVRRRIGDAHRDAGIGARHRDAAAHRAGADDADAVHRCGNRVLRDARHLRDAALGEEGVDERLGLLGLREVEEDLALAGAALGERERGRSLERVDDRDRRFEVTACLARELAPGSEHPGERARRWKFVLSLARLRKRDLCVPPSRARRPTRPSARSPSMMRSISPALSASAALIGLPDTHISIAFSRPTSRGSRCVPSAPGMMPRFTSGCPICASGTATR